MRQSLVKAFLWTIGIVGLCFSVFLSVRHERLSDFSGYYTAAKILSTTDSVSRMYDDEWFVHKMQSYGIAESTFVMYVNPPPVSFAASVLVSFNPFRAKLIWNCFNILLLLVAFRLLVVALNVSLTSTLAPVLFGLLSWSIPLLRNLQRGQLYVLMLVLLVLSFVGFERKNILLTAVPLSILLVLKYFGWMFLLLFIVTKRWKEFGATLAFALALSVGSAAVVGIETYQEHFKTLVAAYTNHDFFITALPCAPAFFGSLFVFHPLWHRNPVADLPLVASTLTFVSMVSVLAFTLKRKNISERMMFGAIAVLSVIFTPLAADHHYILLTLPVAVLIHSTDWNLKSRRMLIVYGFAFIVLMGWYPMFPANQLHGWFNVLSFPRLFAAIALWSLLVSKHMSAQEQ